MTKKKKESFWEKCDKPIQLVLVTIIIVIMFTLLIRGIVYYFNEDFWCSFETNKDKCVCVEPIYECYQSLSFDPDIPSKVKCLETPIGCKTYRKATSQELEIKYCEKNPDDSERCECEEERVVFESNVSLGSSIPIIAKANYTVIHYIDNNSHYLKITKPCTKARPKTECEKGNLDWVEEENIKQAWREKECQI